MDGLIVAKEDSPTRCQSVSSRRQCIYESVAGGTVCLAHGGVLIQKAQERQVVRQYQLRLFQSRLNEKADSPGLKTLRDEIGILRIVLEELLNKCELPVDIIIHAGRIESLALKIEKLVSSCHAIEKSSGKLLDKSAILQFASEVVDILSTHLSDLPNGKDLLETISGEIIAAIDKKE
jgi:hypothetical protein